jgi:hypothetical protein
LFKIIHNLENYLLFVLFLQQYIWLIISMFYDKKSKIYEFI